MKHLFITLLFATTVLCAQAIAGVYETYDNFVNGTLIAFDGGKYQTKGRFLEKTISGKVKGEERTFFLKDIYGVNINNELYRIFNYGGAVVTVKLYTTGAYQLYTNEYILENPTDPGRSSRSSTIFYVSSGLDAEIFRMTSHKELEALAATKPEYKKLMNECTKYKGNVVVKIAYVIYNSPNFKEGKNAVPAVKTE